MITHSTFHHLDQFLEPGDLLVFNDSRIVPSKLFAKTRSGNEILMWIKRIVDEKLLIAHLSCNFTIQENDTIFVGEDPFTILGKTNGYYQLKLNSVNRTCVQVINIHGELVLPDYLQHGPTQQNKIAFQTIYAKKDGSVAAPAAGFHFDKESFYKFKKRNIAAAFITLHVGSDSSSPVDANDIRQHTMQQEWLNISSSVCEQVKETKANGKRVIAVGTTSLRAIESASSSGQLKPYSGYTNIFILPGYQFKTINGLFTNFHQPRSTMMMLISALAGIDNIKVAYEKAIQENYKFLTYGDGMLIL